MIISIIAIFVCASYFIVIFLFYLGWLSITTFSTDSKNPQIYTSIIIPVRNEAQQIEALLKNILNQNLSKEFYEIIIVDDDSEDETATVVKSINQNHFNVFFHNLPKTFSGKKAAILFALNKAKGDLIITTDGDCVMGPKWLSTIVGYYEKHKPKMILGPVLFHEEKNIFHLLQSLEFSSLIASSAGATGIHRPIMCNGANLAFEKSIFFEINNVLHAEITSGDDVFLLHSLKKKYRKDIRFLKSNEAVVFTKPQQTIGSFINQRIRWAGKSKYYFDTDSIVSAIVVLLMNSILLITLLMGCINTYYLNIFALILSVKFITDMLLLHSFLSFFRKQKLFAWFVPMQIIYFVYVCFIGTFGYFVKVKWKGRNVY